MQIINGNFLIPLRYLTIPCILGGICSLNIVISLICAVVRFIIYVVSHNKCHLIEAKKCINAIKGLLLFNLVSLLEDDEKDKYNIITQIISAALSASFWIFVISIATELLQ